METLNAFTVTIRLNSSEDFFEHDFEESCLNNEDNKAKNNKAIKAAIEFLSTLNESRYIGILIVRNEMEKCINNPKCYIGRSLYNTYNHICKDKSNWVTVAEAKNFLMNM